MTFLWHLHVNLFAENVFKSLNVEIRILIDNKKSKFASLPSLYFHIRMIEKNEAAVSRFFRLRIFWIVFGFIVLQNRSYLDATNVNEGHYKISQVRHQQQF